MKRCFLAGLIAISSLALPANASPPASPVFVSAGTNDMINLWKSYPNYYTTIAKLVDRHIALLRDVRALEPHEVWSFSLTPALRWQKCGGIAHMADDDKAVLDIFGQFSVSTLVTTYYPRVQSPYSGLQWYQTMDIARNMLIDFESLYPEDEG